MVKGLLSCPKCGASSEIVALGGGLCECFFCQAQFYTETAEGYFDKFLAHQSEERRQCFNKALKRICEIMDRNTFNVRTLKNDMPDLIEAIKTVKDVDPNNMYAKLYELLFTHSVNIATLERYFGGLRETKLSAEQKVFVIEEFLRFYKSSFYMYLNAMLNDLDIKEADRLRQVLLAEQDKYKKGIFDPTIPRNVFVSYKHEDGEVAAKIIQALERDGNSCWHYKRNLQNFAGEQFWTTIETAIKHCEIFLYIVSERSQDADSDCHRECQVARARNMLRLGYHIDTSDLTMSVKYFFNQGKGSTVLNAAIDPLSVDNLSALKEAVFRLRFPESEQESAQTVEPQISQMDINQIIAQALEADRKKREEEKLKEREVLAKKEEQRQAREDLDDIQSFLVEHDERQERLAQEEEQARKRREWVAKEKEKKAQEELLRQRQAKEQKEREQREQELREKEQREREQREQELRAKGLREQREKEEEGVILSLMEQSLNAAANAVRQEMPLNKIEESIELLTKIISDNASRQNAIKTEVRSLQVELISTTDVNRITEISSRLSKSNKNIAFLESKLSQAKGLKADYEKKREVAKQEKIERQHRDMIEIMAKKQIADFEIENGVLVKYKGKGGKVYLPQSVTSIKEDAFWNCNDIAQVILPDSVTDIGEYAFCKCIGMKSVYLPKGLLSIGMGAFSGCSSLTSVNIPSSVSAIGEGAFENCAQLKEIVVDELNRSYCDVNGVLFSRDKTLLVNYPAGLSESSYAIPSGVNTIGSSAFDTCEGLKSIDVPNSVTSIDSFAFSDCKNLNNIVLPDSVKRIGSGAFKRACCLASITIPSSVTSMGREVFYDWKKHQTVYVDKKSSKGWDKHWKGVCNAKIKYS